MQVFKFGGASVANADKIKHISDILREYLNSKMVIVVSALGKTTNMLEKVADAYFYKKPELQSLIKNVKAIHFDIAKELFEPNHVVFDDLNDQFVELDWFLEDEAKPNFDYSYDQIVSIGELLSTIIVSRYLKDQGFNLEWMDVRDMILTDNNYRAANVDWSLTTSAIQKQTSKKLAKNDIVLTQGYIASSSENFNTTLGREGSDFTTAIFANALNAEKVVVWKDVPGIMTADPKKVKEASFIKEIHYNEMIEMADAGAKVIHPKTIRPLQNKNIPLFVKSFVEYKNHGTKISNTKGLQYPPLIMMKEKQVFLSLSPKTFKKSVSLAHVLVLLDRYKTEVNYLQKSAINIHLCFNDSPVRSSIFEALSLDFEIEYKEQVDLISIRHYDEKTIEKTIGKKVKVLERRTKELYKVILES